MGEGIIDLDVIKPKERVVKLCGKTIDITMISFDIILDIMEKTQTLDVEHEGKDQIAMLRLFKDTINRILKESDKTIDDKWLKANMDHMRYMAAIDQTITPMMNEFTETRGDAKSKKKPDST